MRRILFLLAALSCSETSVTPDVLPSVEPKADEPTAEPTTDPIPNDVVRGAVRGRACLDKSNGLAGAKVALEHPWGVAQTATAVDGSFALENLPVGDYVIVITTGDYRTQIPVSVPPNEFVWVEHQDCAIDCDIPVPCVGLAEAVDRGSVSIVMGDDGNFDIHNTSADLSICMDEWVAVFSTTSQDAVFGQEPLVHLAPGERTAIDYGGDVFGDQANEAWWCVERDQYTQGGAEYTYNGSLAPSILFDDIESRTDKNDTLIEDHEEIVEERYIQTQMNLWASEVAEPIILVGRERSLVQLRRPDSAETVVIEATNLGQKPGSAAVTEIIPPSFVVSNVDPPAERVVLRDGGTSLTWTVSLEAAQPVEGAHAIYDVQKLSYVISRGTDECLGRCEGYGALADWLGTSGPTQRSASEPLIIEVCDRIDDGS